MNGVEKKKSKMEQAREPREVFRGASEEGGRLKDGSEDECEDECECEDVSENLRRPKSTGENGLRRLVICRSKKMKLQSEEARRDDGDDDDESGESAKGDENEGEQKSLTSD